MKKIQTFITFFASHLQLNVTICIKTGENNNKIYTVEFFFFVACINDFKI